MLYTTQGAAVGRIHCGAFEAEAIVADATTAAQAAAMFDRARDLNDRQRRYSASARIFAQIEALPGFRWVVPAE